MKSNTLTHLVNVTSRLSQRFFPIKKKKIPNGYSWILNFKTTDKKIIQQVSCTKSTVTI